MKLNKSYIKQLISEQLREDLDSQIEKKEKAIDQKDLPAAVATNQAEAAAGTAQAQVLSTALVEILNAAAAIGPPGMPIAKLAQDALEAAGAAANEAVEDVQD
jgi:hypothetical protein